LFTGSAVFAPLTAGVAASSEERERRDNQCQAKKWMS